jgi:hypothetical protein
MKSLISSAAAAATTLFASRALADTPLVFDTAGYNSGGYGEIPHQTFHSSDIVAPQFQVNKWEKHLTDNSRFIFLGLWNPLGGNAGPMIYSSEDLSLVYAEQRWPSSHNTRVQTVDGVDYLTFYQGLQEHGHSSGNCLFYDSSYQLVYEIHTRNVTSPVDMHECQVTDAGTVLISVYETIDYDLTSVDGPPDGKLLDSIFQEIDIKTGELLFTWRASDFYPIADSYYYYTQYDHGEEGWDFFHLNSVHKVGLQFATILVGNISRLPHPQPINMS